MQGKTIESSRINMSQVMLPSQSNFEGNIHGGEIMKLMDSAAYATARKHAHCNIVTARVDELQFHLPIFVGELVTCKAELVFVGNTSMEVAVTVEVEDLDEENCTHKALSAYFTMVALDKKGKPNPLPKLILNTPEEKAAFEEGKKRYEMYKARR